MTQKLTATFLRMFFVFFIFLALPAIADNKDDRTSAYVDRFTNEGKLYLLADQGMCFQVVDDKWKLDNWLPGDTITIKRLYGYSSFDFSITNLSNNRTVYAKFAYTAVQENSNDLLRKRIEDLERRMAYLEKVLG